MKVTAGPVSLNIKVDEETAEALRLVSVEDDRSVAAVLRRLIEDGLTRRAAGE